MRASRRFRTTYCFKDGQLGVHLAQECIEALSREEAALGGEVDGYSGARKSHVQEGLLALGHLCSSDTRRGYTHNYKGCC